MAPSRDPSETKICENCEQPFGPRITGKGFYAWGAFDRARTCSRECGTAARRKRTLSKPKKCVQCGETKSRDQFYAHASGWTARCKPCHKEWSARKHRKDPSYLTPKVKANLVERRPMPPFDPTTRTERNFACQLMRKFNLTVEAYNKMVSAQNGVCAICRSGTPNGQRLSVDHCHQTGIVRGLLCQPCNLALGRLEKMLARNPATLEDMLNYLHRA